MPRYQYACSACDNVEDHYRKVDYRDSSAPWCCGKVMRREITAPMLIIPPDVHYDSPIDGRPITSMKARVEDLARSGCQPYDPEMKTDAARYRQEQEKALDAAVDETIDREISTMPARKRETLAQELVNEGLTVEPVRLTA